VNMQFKNYLWAGLVGWVPLIKSNEDKSWVCLVEVSLKPGITVGNEKNMASELDLSRVKDLVFSWFEDRGKLGDSEFYTGYFRTEVAGAQVKRPCIVFFGKTYLYIDAAVCPVEKINLTTALDEPSPYGLSRTGIYLTFHNVLHYDMILNSPNATLELIDLFISQAGKKELELTGELNYKDEDAKLPEEDKAAQGRTISKRTPDKDIIRILAELSAQSLGEFLPPEVDEFVKKADLTIPLAYLINNGMAQPTQKGIEAIRITWDSFLRGANKEDTGSFIELSEILEDLEYDL
jgi:hypothetical protein